MEGTAAAADDSAAAGGEAASGKDPGGGFAITGVIASQLVLITAMLYYFGWVRTDGFLSYFGVDPSVADYSTAEYVLRGIRVAFTPFIYAAFIVLVLFAAHRLKVMPTLETAEAKFGQTSASATHTATGSAACSPTQGTAARVLGQVMALARWTPGIGGVRRFVGAVQVAGVAFAGLVLIGILLPAQIGTGLGLWLPLILIAAVALLGYVSHVRSRYSASLSPAGWRYAVSPSRIYTLTLFTLGLTATLWAVGIYGDQVGTGLATDFVANLRGQPSVTIYSVDRIPISGPGVTEQKISQPDAKFHYEYSELRVLVHSPDRYLLLPNGWRHGQDPIFLLRDNPTIQVNITVQ